MAATGRFLLGLLLGVVAVLLAVPFGTVGGVYGVAVALLALLAGAVLAVRGSAARVSGVVTGFVGTLGLGIAVIVALSQAQWG